MYSELKILVVDDHPVNLEIIRSLLSRLSFKQIDVAVNGQEAVDLFKKDEYAIILMDCQMPIMDGFEATRLIREFETGKGIHTPIIAITADVIQSGRDKCLSAGMDAHMHKPINLAKLKSALEEFI